MRPFLLVAAALYLAFLLEAITGYWVWKPREVASLLPFPLERGEVYTFHVVLLPLVLLFLFSLHTYLSIGRCLGSRGRGILKAGIGVVSISLFLFFLYLHGV